MELPVIPSNNFFKDDPVEWDIIIVGAGVAGAALAAALGRAGRRVLLLERDLSQPDRIVGELLQPGGYIALRKLGLADAVEGIDAQRVEGYALFKNNEDFTIKYPLENMPPDVAGRSFHHGRFVQKLRQIASRQEAVTIRKGTVRRLVNEYGETWSEGDIVNGVTYKDFEGQERTSRAQLTIVCDGMYSTLRKTFVQPEIHHPSHFVGIKIRNCTLPHPNHGHVILGNPSPILVYPISSDVARVLVDIPANMLPSTRDGGLQGYLRDRIAEQMPFCLQEAFLQAVEEGDIKSVKNKQMSARPVNVMGALMLGDAYNMRHPLTGGGMTVALSDCVVINDMLDETFHNSADLGRISQCFREFHDKRKPVSGTINTLANALYSVFKYTNSEAHEELRQACFDYLKMGGMFSKGPIGLLSGLNPSPRTLVVHFFMVAFYGATSFARSSSGSLFSLKEWLLRVSMLAEATGIIFPIVRDEGFNMFLQTAHVAA